MIRLFNFLSGLLVLPIAYLMLLFSPKFKKTLSRVENDIIQINKKKQNLPTSLQKAIIHPLKGGAH